ncbi:MAG: ABC transporter substrate-binding protein [Alphaproteobacteria bacterium]|nr:ABC transporter substrate-binding protein [Alphaproteobacteria bacterium]
MKQISALLLGLSLIALTSPALAAPATGEPIKIGEINVGAKYGSMVLGYKNASQMAVDEINAAGGINGRPLQLIHRDSNIDPATAVKATEDLVTREKVHILMNCDSSSDTLAVANWAAQNKIPFINACSEADSSIWEGGNTYTFRTSQGGYMWASAILNEAQKLYGDKIIGKKWAIVAPSFEFGQSVAKMTKMLAEQRGLKPEWVVEQWPELGKLEAGATVVALKRAQPDIIFNLLWDADLVKFVREGNKRGLFKDRIVIAPPVAVPDHVDLLGTEMPSGWLSVGFPVNEVQDEGYLKFKKAYEAKHKDPIKFYTLTGYNSIQAIAAALRQAGSTDPEKIRAALEMVSYDTPFGKQSFRKIDHQANVPFWVGVSGVKDGKGTLLNWHQENAADHAPTDAWIMEQRKTAP